MHGASLLVMGEINDLIKVKSCIVLIGYSQELEESKLDFSFGGFNQC